MYVRSPGGILVECTSNVPGGFYQDESPEQLGMQLHLPPWYEEQRAELLSMLEPVTIPEESRPPTPLTWVAPPSPDVRGDSPSHIRLSRTKAAFSTRIER
jgi:hypothetical protein